MCGLVCVCVYVLPGFTRQQCTDHLITPGLVIQYAGPLFPRQQAPFGDECVRPLAVAFISLTVCVCMCVCLLCHLCPSG